MKTFTITANQNGKEVERLENVNADKTRCIIRRWSKTDYDALRRLEELFITDEVGFYEGEALFRITLDK